MEDQAFKAVEAEASLAETKGFNDTKELSTTVKEGMTLIDRFYNGGNHAKPEALDILVVVLDSVVGRMRQQYATRVRIMDEANAEIKTIDEQIAAIKPKQEKLKREMEEKQARMKELQASIGTGTQTIGEGVDLAREALEKARLAVRRVETSYTAGMKLNQNGYDGRGRPLPGREVNLRKNPNGPAARKSGDMLKDVVAK